MRHHQPTFWQRVRRACSDFIDEFVDAIFEIPRYT